MKIPKNVSFKYLMVLIMIISSFITDQKIFTFHLMSHCELNYISDLMNMRYTIPHLAFKVMHLTFNV